MMQPQALILPANSRKCKDFGFMQAYLSFKPDLPEDRQSFGALITIDDAILKPDAKRVRDSFSQRFRSSYFHCARHSKMSYIITFCNILKLGFLEG
jgi:hypothetical protein